MSCKHLDSTVVRATLEGGEFIAIHQCDRCGLAVPAREPGEVADIWQLPAFDERAGAKAWDRLYAAVFETVATVSKAAALLRGKASYGKR